MKDEERSKSAYNSGDYWRSRRDLFYYQYVQYIVKALGKDAKSILDVGSGNSPYLDWFFWIPEKVSIDIRAPYSSETVQAITANILDHSFDKRFDICLCLQVLEHIDDPIPFAQRLLELGNTLVVSVPFKWPAGSRHHPQDPVDLPKLSRWFGHEPNYHLVVQEPFVAPKGRRLIAIYDPHDPTTRFRKSFRLPSV